MILYITYVVVIFSVAYLALIFYFAHGWKKIPAIESIKLKVTPPTVSVIVALHNEEKNAASLLNSLINQSFSHYELILVDDFSTDNTLKILQENIDGFNNAKIISLHNHQGKKNAIAEGIKQSTGELIITTDADCSHTVRWIESIVKFYIETKADLISAPVTMRGKGTLFDALQEIEFTSLNASGAGAIGAGKPIMCNAANMAFTRGAWEQSKNELRFDTASGDDVFLLLSVKKHGGKICFLKNSDALVTTDTKLSLKTFFRQRIRWSSKAKYYTDKNIIFTAIVIFGISFSQVVLLVLSFINAAYLFVLLILFILKFMADYIFMKTVNSFYRIDKLFNKSLLLSLVYPFYIFITGTFSFFKPKNRW